MLYSILCYESESLASGRTQQEDDAMMVRLKAVQQKLADAGKLGPVARLMPTSTATTLVISKDPLVVDGPFAETKEQLLGFYIIDCANLQGSARNRAAARQGEAARHPGNPSRRDLQPGRPVAMTDMAWIDAALTSARPPGPGSAAALLSSARCGGRRVPGSVFCGR